jgi:Rrf2 family protein
MIDIAEHNTGEYIPLRDIAQRQEISDQYLENILPSLTKAGFLDGLRGKGGGYRLSRPADTYTVGSILKLVEGVIAPVSCLKSQPNRCPRALHCRTLPMWEDLQKKIDAYFDGITIADLCHDNGGSDFII